MLSRSLGSTTSLSLWGVFTLVLVAQSASAQAFVTPPWNVGDPLTTFQQWDFFTRTSTAPDVGVFNPNGTPSFTQTGGFVTGGGNIYSFSDNYSATVVVPNYGLGSGYKTTVIFQIEKSLGPNEPDIAAPTINGQAASSNETLFEGVIDGFIGPATLGVYKRTYLFDGNAASYTIQIPASIHSSLQAIRVDTQTVAIPEASTLVLAGTASLIAGWMTISSRLSSRRNPADS
jgi:hypothetical protein